LHAVNPFRADQVLFMCFEKTLFSHPSVLSLRPDSTINLTSSLKQSLNASRSGGGEAQRSEREAKVIQDPRKNQ